MTNSPLMPMATAVWLVENTTLTFKQIAQFCKLHEVEIQGIADGEVAKGIKPYHPIISGQLTREEIDLSSKDESRPLIIRSNDIEISNISKKIKKLFENYKVTSNKLASNFLLLNFKNCKISSKLFMSKLLKNRIIVRGMEEYKIKNSLRLSIGNSSENKYLIKIVKKIFKNV